MNAPERVCSDEIRVLGALTVPEALSHWRPQDRGVRPVRHRFREHGATAVVVDT